MFENSFISSDEGMLFLAGIDVSSCPTSRGRNDFINELGLGALPELLNDQLQLFILLVDGA